MSDLLAIFDVAADSREQGAPHAHLLAETGAAAPWFDACALGRPDPARRLLLTDGPEQGYHAILRGLLQQWRGMTGTEPSGALRVGYEGAACRIAEQWDQLYEIGRGMNLDTAQGRALDQLAELSVRGQRRR